MADFTYSGQGSISLLTPLTPAAADWLEEHTPQDADHQYFGPALVIEHRYVDDILSAVEEDGLTIEV